MNEFLSRFNLALIIVTYSAIVLALFQQLNIYIVFLGVLCVCWRAAHFYTWVNLLSGKWLMLVSLLATALTVTLVFQQGIFNILLHIIVLGFSLKFLELKSVRDVYFFVNTGFILTALFFIFNTSIVATFIVSILALMLLAILLSLHAKSIRKSAYIPILIKSSLLSLPLALLLFLVMPRFPALWQVPLQKQATTGLSDTVSPGDIANLSRSSALAFRATFIGEPIEARERYWRAMTLDLFDGKTWSQSTALKREEFRAKRRRPGNSTLLESNQLDIDNNNIKSEYELIIEPHYNHWVPVVDYASADDGLIRLSDYSLRSQKPIVTRKSISVVQLNQDTSSTLTDAQIQQFTQLPSASSTQDNQQTDAWIEAKLRQGVSKNEVLKQLLEEFSAGFRYTLSPPLLEENQIDDFLFNSKAGFCVHYASSFLYVARRLGFPARMVTGYLGGEWQETEGFFIVRQYDAHAWVEIWRNNAWERVDPTAYVASERVESGLQAGLTDSNEFLAGQLFSLEKWRSFALVNQLRAKISQVDYLWARYVVNFDNQTQIKLMQKWLEKMPWLKLTYAILLVMAVIFLMLLVFIFKPWKVKKRSREDQVYLKLQEYFSKLGYQRQSGQSVSEYCFHISEHFSLPIALCDRFSEKYNEIKYQPKLSPEAYKKRLKQLTFLSKQLKKQSRVTPSAS